MNYNKFSLTLIVVVVTAAFILMGLPENFLNYSVRAETWTQTTTSEFNNGETAFIDPSNDQLQLDLGIAYLWSDYGMSASDYFGFGHANAGDVNGDGYDDVIVGAYGDDGGGSSAGEAYVYFGAPDGPSESPDWSDLGMKASDYYGYDVSGAGDVNGDGYDDIIVGAYLNDSDPGVLSAAGAAYLYFGSSSGPSATPDWFDYGGFTSSYFGMSVSGAGDVNGDGYDDIIVGAYYSDAVVTNAGAAHVYYGSASGPSATPDWTRGGDSSADYFGYAVSGAGDVNGDGYDDVIVGAYQDDKVTTSTGSAYVYLGSSSGLSTTPDWSDTGEAGWDYFGISVSGAGDVNGDGYDEIIVGAYGNDGGGSMAGEAYVYFGSSSGPSTNEDWSDQGEAASDYFGYRNGVSEAGDVNGDGYDDIIVGAYLNDEVGGSGGKAYVYFGAPSGPSADPDWTELGDYTGDYFGRCVRGGGDVNGDGNDDFLVGAYYHDNPLSTASGKVFLFGIPPQKISETWSAVGDASSDYFGTSVANAGDVNGDGYDDIIIGAYQDETSVAGAGAAYIYFGSATGPGSTYDWKVGGATASDYFGYSVSGAGDVNGDGYDDVIIGAYGDDGNGGNAGEAYVYFGSASGPSTGAADWSDLGMKAGDNYGYSVSGAGDVNNDGYDDIIVGAYYNDSDPGVLSSAGAAYVYFGSSSGPSATPDWFDYGDGASYYFGTSVSDAGDVNRDGYDDIIVGAYNSDAIVANAGAAHVYYGSSTGPSATPDWTRGGDSSSDYYGNSVSGAGDVNGDGYDDVIVGAKYDDQGVSSSGTAYVYYGSSTGVSTTPNWKETGNAGTDYFGKVVSDAGDVDGDGYDDILVCAPYAEDGTTGSSAQGEIYLYYGGAGGPSTVPNWMEQGDCPSDYLGGMDNSMGGQALSGAGDVNGDGYADIVAGSPYNDEHPSYTTQGKVHLYTRKYAPWGRYISDTFSVDGNENIIWTSVNWKLTTQPSGTSVKFQISTSDDGLTWNFVGPDGTASTYFTNPNGGTIPSDQTGRFLKVMIYLTTDYDGTTPVVTEFDVNYRISQSSSGGGGGDGSGSGLPTVMVTSPNGGEDWMKSEDYPITWDATGELDSTSVTIDYSTNAGSSWTNIDTDVANTGFYVWTVPNVDTSDALIKITVTDIYGNIVNDTSDATFAIDPPPGSVSGISMDSPSIGTVFGAETQSITWVKSGFVDAGPGSVNLEWSSDNGATWEELQTGLDPTDSYLWTIPDDVNQRDCLLRLSVRLISGGVARYTSEPFSIDTKEPTMEHEPMDYAQVGEMTEFTAIVEDNFMVKSVELYYDDGSGYKNRDMLFEEGEYRTSLSLDKGPYHYYIKATDGANEVTTDVYTMEVGTEEDDRQEETGASVSAMPVIILIVLILVLLVSVCFSAFLLVKLKGKDEQEMPEIGRPARGRNGRGQGTRKKTDGRTNYKRSAVNGTKGGRRKRTEDTR